MMKRMKLFAALFCAALTLGLSSCSKDDFEKDIVGTWKALDITYTETYNGESHTETMTPDGDNRLTFNSDKTFVATTDGVTEASGTWSISDDKLTMTGTSVEDGRTMTEKYTIDIDGSNMTLSNSEDYSEAGVTASMKMVMRLKKV